MSIQILLENTYVAGFASNQLEVENLTHWEGLPLAASGTSLTATLTAEPSQPRVLAGTANMLPARPVGSWSHETSPELMSQVTRAFMRGVRSSGLAVAGAMGRAAGRAGLRWAGGRIAAFYNRRGLYRTA